MDLASVSVNLTDLAAEAKRPDPAEVYDLLVLGGGPAAMTAVLYAARKMMKLAMVTYDFGGQMAETSEIENYMGYRFVTGLDLTDKFKEQVQQFDIPIAWGQKVTAVRRGDGRFTVETDQGGAFQARTLILATGKRYRLLGVPGEKELAGHGVAYCPTCDAPFFKNKVVFIAGGGNSAFTAALDLVKVARDVTMLNFAADWQADPILQQAVERFGDRVKRLDQQHVLAIEGNGRVESVRVQDRRTGEERSLPADGVFIEIGLTSNSEPFAGFVELNEKKEVVVDCATRTNVPGVFGAGDLTTVPYKQIVISTGEGAKAALAAYDYLIHRGLL